MTERKAQLWELELAEAERRYREGQRKAGDLTCSWKDHEGKKHWGYFQPEQLKQSLRS